MNLVQFYIFIKINAIILLTHIFANKIEAQNHHQMKFLPIEINDQDNEKFKNNPECKIILDVFQEHYKKVGFMKPWIAYFVSDDTDEIVGGGGFKGQPKNGNVEIAYGTFKNFEGKGVGTEICKQLVNLAIQTDPAIKITARTLPENGPSIRILEINGFKCVGKVIDEEDGEVLEWVFMTSESGIGI
jgi:[ribosomal protein S5]-alanine N-acetyltransferase